MRIIAKKWGGESFITKLTPRPIFCRHWPKPACRCLRTTLWGGRCHCRAHGTPRAHGSWPSAHGA